MKIQTSTAWLPILDVDSYGGALADFYETLDDEENVYREVVDETVVNYALSTITEMFTDSDVVARFGKMKAVNGKITRPRFYNYEPDYLDFEIEVDDFNVMQLMNSMDLTDKSLYKFFEREFGSHPGFISFFPTTKEKYKEALEAPYESEKFGRAFSMYLYWIMQHVIYKEDMWQYQKDFVDDVTEHGNRNGWFRFVEDYE